MATLSVLKAEHSHRLPVGYQHYGYLMTEKIFDNFCIKKLINPKISQSQLQTPSRSAMMKIYAKYSSEGTRLWWRR